jgi:hypothetical protein
MTIMLKVTVTRAGPNGIREERQIEFHGIAVTCGRVPFSFQCTPPGVVSDETARRIADDLSCGFGVGEIGGIEWQMTGAVLASSRAFTGVEIVHVNRVLTRRSASAKRFPCRRRSARHDSVPWRVGGSC